MSLSNLLARCLRRIKLHLLRYGTPSNNNDDPPERQLSQGLANSLSNGHTSSHSGKQKILLIGHAASPTGAPILLLNIGRVLKEKFGLEIVFILLQDGPMEPVFQSVANTYIIHKDYSYFEQLCFKFWQEGFTTAICNSVATGKCTKILQQAGFTIVSAIHEMPVIIEAMALEDDSKTMHKYSHRVVFPTDLVQKKFENIFGSLGDRAIISPQGLFAERTNIENARKKVCDKLSIPYNSKLIISVGFGDMRKGIDLFFQLARKVISADDRFHFIWIGSIAADLAIWLKHDMNADLLGRNFHHLSEFVTELSLYYDAADLFISTAREDPFPSAMLEALAHGLPVVAFDQCGGYIEHFSSVQNGVLVPYPDVDKMTQVVRNVADNAEMYDPAIKIKRSEYISNKFDFVSYVSNLLELFDPLQTISQNEGVKV